MIGSTCRVHIKFLLSSPFFFPCEQRKMDKLEIHCFNEYRYYIVYNMGTGSEIYGEEDCQRSLTGEEECALVISHDIRSTWYEQT